MRHPVRARLPIRARLVNASAPAVPYPPSWIDRLTERIDRLPGPDWLVYAAAAVAILAVITLVQWRAGTYPVGTLYPYHIGAAATIPGWLWFVRRLNLWARRAVDGLPPALLPESRAEELAYRLAVLPAVPTLALSVSWMAATLVAFTVRSTVITDFGFSLEPVAFAVAVVFWTLLTGTFAAFWLKVVYQAWWIHRLLTSEVKVDVWAQAPLHAFSGLTAWMAVGLIFPSVGALLYAPGVAFQQSGTIVSVVGGALIFVLPLVGMHGRLAAEKERLLAETATQIQGARRRLHQAGEAGESEAMDPLQKQMSALEIDQRIVGAIPTWPWQPETLRWVLGALMFPIVLFVLQQLLGPLVASGR